MSATPFVLTLAHFLTMQLQGRRDLYKWERTSFPWFEQIEMMFGDTLAVGTHSFRPGQQPALAANSSGDDDFTHIIAIPSTRTLVPSTCNTPADLQLQPQAQESGSIISSTPAKHESTPVDTPGTKRCKVIGVAVMQEMSKGLRFIADVIQPILQV